MAAHFATGVALLLDSISDCETLFVFHIAPWVSSGPCAVLPTAFLHERRPANRGLRNEMFRCRDQRSPSRYLPAWLAIAGIITAAATAVAITGPVAAKPTA